MRGIVLSHDPTNESHAARGDQLLCAEGGGLLVNPGEHQFHEEALNFMEWNGFQTLFRRPRHREVRKRVCMTQTFYWERHGQVEVA